MKTLPAYQSKGKKKEKALITKQITVMMDEAAAVKKEAEVGSKSRDTLSGVCVGWLTSRFTVSLICVAGCLSHQHHTAYKHS